MMTKCRDCDGDGVYNAAPPGETYDEALCSMCHGTGELNWPTWLNQAEFIAWYEDENRKRLGEGEEQLPDLPPEVAEVMGLRNDPALDETIAGIEGMLKS